MSPTANGKACLHPASGFDPVSLTGEAQRSDESLSPSPKHAYESGQVMFLFLVVLASLGMAIVAVWFSLHTAKGIAKMHIDRIQAVERMAGQEDGR